jgi:hypothetical protein
VIIDSYLFLLFFQGNPNEGRTSMLHECCGRPCGGRLSAAFESIGFDCIAENDDGSKRSDRAVRRNGELLAWEDHVGTTVSAAVNQIS